MEETRLLHAAVVSTTEDLTLSLTRLLHEATVSVMTPLVCFCQDTNDPERIVSADAYFRDSVLVA